MQSCRGLGDFQLNCIVVVVVVVEDDYFAAVVEETLFDLSR